MIIIVLALGTHCLGKSFSIFLSKKTLSEIFQVKTFCDWVFWDLVPWFPQGLCGISVFLLRRAAAFSVFGLQQTCTSSCLIASHESDWNPVQGLSRAAWHEPASQKRAPDSLIYIRIQPYLSQPRHCFHGSRRIKKISLEQKSSIMRSAGKESSFFNFDVDCSFPQNLQCIGCPDK